MGITEEEYRRMMSRTVAMGPAAFIGSSPMAKGKTTPRDRGPNKTEIAYMRYLDVEKREGRINDYKFESVKLRLADRTFITFDFLVIDCDGFVQFHDTKGYWKSKGAVHVEDDAAVKGKVAAEQYPYFEFRIVWMKDGAWQHKVY